MITRRSLQSLLVLLSTAAFGFAGPSFVPDTGTAAVRHHAVELNGRLRVLSLTLRPGEEDCALLAFLRLGRGASLTSVYVTNGEKGELDSGELLPADVAVTRRADATKAMLSIDAEAIFLNMTDPDAALDEAGMRAFWSADTLEFRLNRILEASQPDLVILMADGRGGPASAASAMLQRSVVKVCSRLAWKIGQILVETPGGRSTAALMKETHRTLGRTYAAIGDSVRARYASMHVQLSPGVRHSVQRYMAVFPLAAVNAFFRKDIPMAGRVPDSLRALETQVLALAREVLRGKTQGTRLVSRILPVLQRVDRSFGRTGSDRSKDHRVLIDWKEALENMRAAALGVYVRYTLEYNVLCERQLVRLSLDEIGAKIKLSPMEIMIPEVGRGWIANEALKSRIPVKTGDTLRLITPDRVDYDLPFAQNAQLRPTFGRLFSMMLVHMGTKKEESFVFRLTPRIFFSPRFSAEMLTPIVRGMNGEEVIARLTNHSRDGVADILAVEDSLATSSTAQVRLSWKEAFSVDTLVLAMRDSVEDGTFILPLRYGGVPVTRFLVRTFTCGIDTHRSVGVLSAWKNSALRDALRRIGIRETRDLAALGVAAATLKGLDAVVLDRRVLSLRETRAGERQALRDFAAEGGTVVVLAQDPRAWNASPVWQGLRVDASPGNSPMVSVVADTSDPLLARPNQLSHADFSGWLTRLSHDRLSVSSMGSDLRIPVHSAAGEPLLVHAGVGRGRVIYVGLAVGPQWMNITPGALRLLANILAH